MWESRRREGPQEFHVTGNRVGPVKTGSACDHSRYQLLSYACELDFSGCVYSVSPTAVQVWNLRKWVFPEFWKEVVKNCLPAAPQGSFHALRTMEAIQSPLSRHHFRTEPSPSHSELSPPPPGGTGVLEPTTQVPRPTHLLRCLTHKRTSTAMFN